MVCLDKKIIALLKDNVSLCPPETGGIIGVKENVICELAFDNSKSSFPCSYTPNVELLNEMIEEWESNGIRFCGLFHTHFANVSTLSEGDIEYIEKIMLAMPDYVNYLYFPIYTLPNRELTFYRAFICNNRVIVEKTDYELVDASL